MTRTLISAKHIVAAIAISSCALGAQAQEVRSHAAALCFDTVNKLGVGNPLRAWPCNGGGNQKFLLKDLGPATPDGRVTRAQITVGNLCVARRYNDVEYQICSYQGQVNADAVWWFDRNFPANANPAAGVLRVPNTDVCLDLSGSAAEWGVAGLLGYAVSVIRYRCHYETNQRWWVNF